MKLFLIGSLFAFAHVNLYAATVTIEGDEIHHDHKNSTSTALGNAIIIDHSGRFKKTLQADTVIAYHDEQNKPNKRKDENISIGVDTGGDIAKADAIGNVRITENDRILTADKCVYMTKNKTANCKGSITLKTATEKLTGEKLTAHMESQVYTLYGGKKQAHAVITRNLKSKK